MDGSRSDGYIDGYETYSVAEAKNQLPKLIDRALAGEEVVITRRGKPVVELKQVRGRGPLPKAIHDWLFRANALASSVGLTSVEILDLLNETDQDEHIFGRSFCPDAWLKKDSANHAYLNAVEDELLVSEFAARGGVGASPQSRGPLAHGRVPWGKPGPMPPSIRVLVGGSRLAPGLWFLDALDCSQTGRTA